MSSQTNINLDPPPTPIRPPPPPPPPADVQRYSNFSDEGQPTQVDDMVLSKEQGVLHLASLLWLQSGQQKWKGTDPFSNRATKYADVVKYLLAMSPNLLSLMIEGRLHRAHILPRMPGLYLMADNLVPFTDAEKEDAIPHVYALTHCNAAGVPPSPNEYLRALNYIEEYLEVAPISSPRWQYLDALAHDIDELSPSGRDWSFMTKSNQRWRWTMNGKTQKPHPRRYCLNFNQNQETKVMIEALRQRLMKISVTQHNQPTPWSLSYIGFTSTDNREWEHNTHSGLGTTLKNVMEAVMAIKVAPQNTYFMRSLRLFPVFESADAGLAEHLAHLLCSSYSRFGGLNGSLAGGGTLMTAVKELGDMAWINAARQAIKQGVFARNCELLEQEIEARIILKKITPDADIYQRFDTSDDSRRIVLEEVEKKVEEFCDTISEHARVIGEQLELRAENFLLRNQEAILDAIDLDFS